MLSRPAAKLLMMVALIASSGVILAEPRSSSADPLPQLTRDDVSLLDGVIEAIRQDFSIPGLAVGIVEAGQPVYVRGFGIRDSRVDQPVDSHTLFHVGALTRTFTAAAIMQLAERGQLTLDDSIADSSVTIAQLLMRDDAAFDALAGVVEGTVHQPYSAYMQTHVLDAASMAESTFGVPPVDSNLAWPHVGRIFVSRAPEYPWEESTLPSAGLSASVADLTHWAALHVRRDPSLLRPGSYDTLFKRQRDDEGERTTIALGWTLEHHGSEWLPSMSSKGSGFSALLTLYPSQQRAIVVLASGEMLPGREIRGVIEAILAGEGYVLPKPSFLARSDLQWAFVGLLTMCVLLIATTLHRRRRPA